jgi:hypothetical protein
MNGDTSKKADVSIEPRRIKDVRVYVAKGRGADYESWLCYKRSNI